MLTWLRTRVKSEPLMITLAAFVVALLRAPLLLFHGRVNAEEGTVYLQQAWDLPSLQSFELPHQGYYSLLMNGLALLTAKVFPLEWAAVIFVWAALLILLLTVYLAASCEAFHRSRTRLIAAGVCMFTPALEVWLTAEDAQFYLAACVALICISSELRHRVLRNGTLLVAGLTGPVSCVFTPFFWWRALRRRTAEAWMQVAILTGCTGLQAVILLRSVHIGGRSVVSQTLAEWFGPVLVLKIFVLTFFTRVGARLTLKLFLRHPDLTTCLIFWVIFFSFFTLFWKVATIAGEPGKLCFGMAFASLLFDYIGTTSPLRVVFLAADRYFFTGFLLLWMVIALAYARADEMHSSINRKITLSLVSLALLSGLIDSAHFWSGMQGLDPPWTAQVAAWRKDPATPVRVAPAWWPDTVHLRLRERVPLR